MGSIAVIIVATAVAVGFLVLGMSLTLIFKGRHMRSEIGGNPEMQKRGIECTAEWMRRHEQGARGEKTPGCAAPVCGECSRRAECGCGMTE